MSLSRLLAGRKRESRIWDYFESLENADKSKCLVVTPGSTLPCGTLLAESNTSNMISHLSRLHNEAYNDYIVKEKERQSNKKGVKRQGSGNLSYSSGSAPKSKTQSLEQCIQRHIISWPHDSQEYKTKLAGVMQMVIESGYLVSMVDLPSFKRMLKNLDTKFNVSG